VFANLGIPAFVLLNSNSTVVTCCALIGVSRKLATGSLWTRLVHDLVDTSRVCPGIHMVRARTLPRVRLLLDIDAELEW